MKKILLMAMAAVAMVGCSQNEEIENAAQNAEINFQTAVSSTTRAAVTNLNELKKEGVGFTVQAYNTGNTKIAAVTASSEMKAFMTDAKATFNTDWELSGGPYYWPLTDNIQFFAYGNEGTGTLVYNTPTTNYPSITYTVADVAAQTDFVVAKVTDATKANAATGVSLGFTHALTQINFTIKCADALTYKLKSLEIVGVKNKGTYSFENAKWGSQEGTATYAHTIVADGVEVPTGATGLVQDVAWMLMPQTLPTTGASIRIGYEVYDNGVLIYQEDASTLDLKDTQAWEEGKKMRYTLTLSNKGAKISLVVPEVGTWNTTDDANVEK